MDRSNFMSKALAILAATALIALVVLSGNLFQNVNADEIVVIQAPFSGTLTWHTEPGTKWQGFGRVTTYPKRGIYYFKNVDANVEGAVKKYNVRFNDGAHGNLVGSIQYELPLNPQNLTTIHTQFGSAVSLQEQLIQTIVDKATYMTGPLMSSKESYAEMRNQLIWFVEDQVANGVYRTRQTEQRTKDPITEVEKTVTVAEIVLGADGKPERVEHAVLSTFGIRPLNFSIKDLNYEERVENQISAQQQAVMDVQTAMAEAKKAEQRALTAAMEYWFVRDVGTTGERSR